MPAQIDLTSVPYTVVGNHPLSFTSILDTLKSPALTGIGVSLRTRAPTRDAPESSPSISTCRLCQLLPT